MIKKTHIIIAIVVLAVIAMGIYSVFFLVFQNKGEVEPATIEQPVILKNPTTKTDTPSGPAMTKELCEEQGGQWDWMEIMKNPEDGGDDFFYQCTCADNGPLIREGQEGRCP